MSNIYVLIIIVILLAVIFGGAMKGFNAYLGIYIVLALLVIGGGASKLFGSGQTLGGALFLVGSVLVFSTFGTKWFGKGAVFSETPVSWPPAINTCPDYLTSYSRTMPDGTKQDSCIDQIGISKNGSLKIFPKDGTPPTTDEYYFSLMTKSSDSTKKNQELCQRAITMGLTWEGVTNGESCITPAGPVAPGGGGNGGGGGGGGGGCPA
jgi:hypothetical protein